MPMDIRSRVGFLRPRKHRFDGTAGSERIAYLDSRRPRSPQSAGAPILLLHGFTADRWCWLEMFGRLAGQHRLIAPELAGHGASSEAADGDYTIVRQARRARALVERLTPPVGPHHVLGHSMGGGVATEYAIRYAGDVLSLGLIAPAVAQDPHTPEFHKHIENCINPLIVAPGWRFMDKVHYVIRGPARVHRRFKLLSPLLAPRERSRRARYETIFGQLAPDVRKPPSCSPGEEREDAPPPRERPSYADGDFTGIRQPTFILWGADDRVLKPEPDYITSRMDPEVPAHAEDLWEKTGHTPIMEKPGPTAATYLRFLDKIAS